LIAVRDQVNVALERQRKEKVIGNSLAARVTLAARGETAALLERYRADLPTILIVSEVDLRPGEAEPPGGAAALAVSVARADGVRCDRCWRYVLEVARDEAHRGVCPRCVEALEGDGR
jgi:isoleucyl-tRNA synthetase